MKMSEIKRNLKNEVSKMMPVEQARKTEVFVMKKKNNSSFRKIIAGTVAACLVVAIVIAAVVIINNNKGPEATTSYVSIDINPSVELVLDKDNKVVSYRAANDDAQVLFVGAEKEGKAIVGADVSTATQNLVSIAIECGYLSEENNAVNVTATTSVDAKLGEIVENAVKTAAGTLQVAVGEGVDIVLTHELEVLKEQKKDSDLYDKYYKDLSLGKFKLMKSARAGDRSITMDEAVKMTEDQLIAVVKESHEYYKNKLSAAAELAVLAAEYAYEGVLATIDDGAYYLIADNRADESLIGGISTGVKVTKYILYRSTYRTLDYAGKLISAYNENPLFTDEDITRLTGVTQEEIDAFKADMDEYEELTRDNIQKYIKKLSAEAAKLSEETAEYDEIQIKIDVALQVNDELNNKAEYVGNADLSVVTGLSGALGQISEFLSGVTVPSSSELKEMTIASYYDILEKLEAKSNEIIEDMDLTDAEKQLVADEQAKNREKIDNAMATMKAAIEEAVAEAKAVYEKIYNTRIQINADVNVSVGA